MKVKNIKWISELAKEAEITITDGKYECIAFSQPCNSNMGDKLTEPLHALFTEKVMISENKNCSLTLNKKNSISYDCIAMIIDMKNNIVKVGKILIVLDEKLPSDIKEGDMIEFSCIRLDAW